MLSDTSRQIRTKIEQTLALPLSFEEREKVRRASLLLSIPLSSKMLPSIPFETATSSEEYNVQNLPLESIFIDKARFQPREDFSEEKVREIVQNFNPALFKPLIVWQDPQDDKTYVLAGHHRYEALKRMKRKSAPVIFAEGDEQKAVEIAWTENMAGRTQTAAENAKYLRKLALSGRTKTDIESECKRLYDKNCTVALDLSHLNPRGKALVDLSLLSRESETFRDQETMAQWIGKLRGRFEELTNSHENEIYDYLRENYKIRGRKFRSYSEFQQFMEDVIMKRTEFGKIDERLNIGIVPKSAVALEYDEQLARAERELTQALDTFENEFKKSNARKIKGEITEEQRKAGLQRYEDAVTIAQREVLRLRDARSTGIKEARESEISLWGLRDKNSIVFNPEEMKKLGYSSGAAYLIVLAESYLNKIPPSDAQMAKFHAEYLDVFYSWGKAVRSLPETVRFLTTMVEFSPSMVNSSSLNVLQQHGQAPPTETEKKNILRLLEARKKTKIDEYVHTGKSRIEDLTPITGEKFARFNFFFYTKKDIGNKYLNQAKLFSGRNRADTNRLIKYISGATVTRESPLIPSKVRALFKEAGKQDFPIIVPDDWSWLQIGAKKIKPIIVQKFDDVTVLHLKRIVFLDESSVSTDAYSATTAKETLLAKWNDSRLTAEQREQVRRAATLLGVRLPAEILLPYIRNYKSLLHQASNNYSKITFHSVELIALVLNQEQNKIMFIVHSRAFADKTAKRIFYDIELKEYYFHQGKANDFSGKELEKRWYYLQYIYFILRPDIFYSAETLTDGTWDADDNNIFSDRTNRVETLLLAKWNDSPLTADQREKLRRAATLLGVDLPEQKEFSKDFTEIEIAKEYAEDALRKAFQENRYKVLQEEYDESYFHHVINEEKSNFIKRGLQIIDEIKNRKNIEYYFDSLKFKENRTIRNLFTRVTNLSLGLTESDAINAIQKWYGENYFQYLKNTEEKKQEEIQQEKEKEQQKIEKRNKRQEHDDIIDYSVLNPLLQSKVNKFLNRTINVQNEHKTYISIPFYKFLRDNKNDLYKKQDIIPTSKTINKGTYKEDIITENVPHYYLGIKGTDDLYELNSIVYKSLKLPEIFSSNENSLSDTADLLLAKWNNSPLTADQREKLRRAATLLGVDLPGKEVVVLPKLPEASINLVLSEEQIKDFQQRKFEATSKGTLNKSGLSWLLFQLQFYQDIVENKEFRGAAKFVLDYFKNANNDDEFAWSENDDIVFDFAEKIIASIRIVSPEEKTEESAAPQTGVRPYEPKAPVNWWGEYENFYRSTEEFFRTQIIADREAQIQRFQERIEALQEVPASWQGTKKEYLESVQEQIQQLRGQRDNIKTSVTRLRNNDLTSDDKNALESRVRPAFEEQNGVLTAEQRDFRLKKLMQIVFTEDSSDEQFFPTPRDVIEEMMLPLAAIKPGMRVLEPSAGKGDIADAIRDVTGVQPEVVELNPIRAEVLRLKGYNVVHEGDFLDYRDIPDEEKYDVIVMNPPFLKGLDIIHVRHAYDKLLKPGGKIVAIMGARAIKNLEEFDAAQFYTFLTKRDADITLIPRDRYNKRMERKIMIDIALIAVEKPLKEEVVSTDFVVENGEWFKDKVRGGLWVVTDTSDPKGYTLAQYPNMNTQFVELRLSTARFEYVPSDKLDEAKRESMQKGKLPDRSEVEFDTEFREPRFITARASYSQMPKENHLAPQFSNILKQHQLDGVNLAIEALDSPIGGFLNADGTGAGKAQPLDAQILTPKGWKKMGDIVVGDEVIAVNGKSTKVTGVFPQGKKAIYRVNFNDGSSTETCKEHLWFTQTWVERRNQTRYPNNPKWFGQVRSLEEISTSLFHSGGQANHSIPIVQPVELEAQNVSIDPYLLGLLLGDGGLSRHSIFFSTASEEILNNLQQALPDDVIAKKTSKYDFLLKGLKGKASSLKKALNDLGLTGKKSHDKFIPEKYKYNSIDVRIAVLQGLMDTDGSCDRRGTSSYFYTVSEQLAKDVKFIVQSLGGLVRISTKHPKYTHNKELRIGANVYILTLTMPSTINPFRLSEKANKVLPKTKYSPKRYIKSVEFVGEKEAQCIAVEHPQHLYVTDECIVTHNTAQELALAYHYVSTTGKAVVIFTESDQIMQQAFFGDARRLLGLPTPDAIEGGDDDECKDPIPPRNYKGLYGLYDAPKGSPAMAKSGLKKIPVRAFNPKAWTIEPGTITVALYHHLSLWGQNHPAEAALEQAIKEKKRIDAKYTSLREQISAYVKNKTYTAKQGTEARAALREEQDQEPIYAELVRREQEWEEVQARGMKPFVEDAALVILDEAHNCKNTTKTTKRALRAKAITDRAERVAFFTATPTDKAGDCFYLKRTGLYRSESEWKEFLKSIGYEWRKPKFNLKGEMIRQGEWRPLDGYPTIVAAMNVENKFAMLTEDGYMIKREIELLNMKSPVMVDIPLPPSIDRELETIEEALHERAKNKGREQESKAVIIKEQQRYLEKYKIDKAMEITRQKLSEGRSVIIFCDLVDEGEEAKAWGETRIGTVQVLKNRIESEFGEEIAGMIIGVENNYEFCKRLSNIRDFQSGEKRVVLATYGSGGTGISLDDTVGNMPRTIILMTVPPSAIPAVQAFGRVVRTASKSRAEAYALFGENIDVEVRSKNLLATKMDMLGAAVSGQVTLLRPREVEEAETAGYEAIAPSGNTQIDEKHSLWARKEIDGESLPSRLLYTVTRSVDRFHITVRIGAKSLADINRFAQEYKELIQRFTLERDSNPYQGTFYQFKIENYETNPSLRNDEAKKREAQQQWETFWNYILNWLKPENNRYTLSQAALFNVGDTVFATEDIIVGDVKKGQSGRVTRLRERDKGGAKYYLYDVAWEHGTETQNVFDKSITLSPAAIEAQGQAIERQIQEQKAEEKRKIEEQWKRDQEERQRQEEERMRVLRERQAEEQRRRQEEQERRRQEAEESQRRQQELVAKQRQDFVQNLLEREFGTLIDLALQKITEEYINAPKGSEKDDIADFTIAATQALVVTGQAGQAKDFIKKVIEWKAQNPPAPNKLATAMEAAMIKAGTPSMQPQAATEPSFKQLSVTEGFHTKKKIPIWLAKINGGRLSRDEYMRVKDIVSDIGGYWSPYSDAFVFEDGDPTEKLQAQGLADVVSVLRDENDDSSDEEYMFNDEAEYEDYEVFHP